MTFVINTYKLKPSVTMKEYKTFSKTLDQVKTPKMPGVKSFKVVEIKGSDKGSLPYQIAEILEVESWGSWQKVMNSPDFQDVVKAFLDLADTNTLVTTYGEQI